MQGSEPTPGLPRQKGWLSLQSLAKPVLFRARLTGIVLLFVGCASLQAQMEFAIERFAITNYTSYLIEGDTGSGGRQAIRTLTSMFFTNSSSTAETLDFQLAYQLVDTAGLPLSILDENGQT